jgi:4-hydroxy-3-polyprenylbenzoate decarboxylase
MKDLQGFVRLLEEEGELKRVKVAVSKELEVTEIVNRVSKGPPEENKAILFEEVEGHKIPMVANLFGSRRRMSLAFGLKDLSELEGRVSDFLRPDVLQLRGSLFELAGRGLRMLRTLRSLAAGKIVEKAPCQELVFREEADLGMLPVPRLWPKDAGPYITLPQVVTLDPETGRRNVGMYRLQVIDNKRLIVHWQRHKDGREHEQAAKRMGLKSIPSAIVLGGDPLCIWAACLPAPPGIEEYAIVSFLRQTPLEMVRCVTQPLTVPAHAEIVLEGYINVEEKELEGPFGDHTGFYSERAPFPVFYVTAITMKKAPLFPFTVTGVPPMEDFWMGKAVERFAIPFLRLLLPELKDISMPSCGTFHNLLLASIKKSYPGQARRVINAIFGLGLLSLTKAIVVVDEEVDLEDLHTVAWYVLANVDWRRDVMIIDGPLDELDHASSQPLFGGKIGIDATKKMREEGYGREWPERVGMDEAIVKKVDEKWGSLGLF